jgi:competence protein ComFC
MVAMERALVTRGERHRLHSFAIAADWIWTDMAKFKARKIYGSWKEGYVLDLHSTGSTCIGDNEFGHPQFDTHRTEIGELLFRLKYRADESAAKELVDAASDFIRSWGANPSIIIPVPPTRIYRRLQPVARLADGLGKRLKIPVAHDAIRKLKQFAELKNVYDAEERRKLLEGAFEINAARATGHRVLLVDDLYRSGATMNAIAQGLTRSGASAVFVFAFTQTRSRA